MDDLDKLKHYIIAGGFDSQADLAKYLGVFAANISEWKSKGKVPKKHMQKLEKEFGIIEKEGSTIRFIRDPDQISTHLAKRVTVDAVVLKDTEIPSTTSNIIKIPIIEAKASAGSGIEHFEVETKGELLIDQMLFKVLPTLKNVRAIAVSGDSMTPALQDGDYVVIEESVRFSGDGIYVLQYDGVLLVKRLQADLDGIEILSDNQKYKARTYNPNDDQRSFHIIGKVILRIQR